MDSRCTPANIGRLHLSDELPYFGINGQPAWLGAAAVSRRSREPAGEAPLYRRRPRYTGAMRMSLRLQSR